MAQVIAIWGANFSGSTLLSYVLGSIPGIKNGGELHAIQDKGLCCTICRPVRKCPVFPSPPQLKETPPEQFYDAAAKALGTEVLVSSDKNLSHYGHYLRDHHNPKNLIIWRTPAESWRSHQKRHFPSFLLYWVKVYQEAFDFLDNRGYPYISIHHAQFCKQPNIMLKAICEWLEIPYHKKALQYWETDHHSIGGNVGPLVNMLGLNHPRVKDILERKGPERAAYYKENFRVIRSAPPSLDITEEQQKLLESNINVWSMIERLRECHLDKVPLDLPKTPKPSETPDITAPPSPAEQARNLFHKHVDGKNGFTVRDVQIPVAHQNVTLPPFMVPVAFPKKKNSKAKGLVCHMGGYGAASIAQSNFFCDFLMAGFHEGAATSYYRLYDGSLFGFDIYAQMIESLRKKFRIKAQNVILWGPCRAGVIALYATLKYNYGACVAFQPAIDIMVNLPTSPSFLRPGLPKGDNRHVYESRYMALVFKAIQEGLLTPQQFKELVPSLFITSLLHQRKKIPNITITYGEQNPIDDALCFHFRSYAERFPNFKAIAVPTAEHDMTKILREDISNLLLETWGR